MAGQGMGCLGPGCLPARFPRLPGHLAIWLAAAWLPVSMGGKATHPASGMRQEDAAAQSVQCRRQATEQGKRIRKRYGSLLRLPDQLHQLSLDRYFPPSSEPKTATDLYVVTRTHMVYEPFILCTDVPDNLFKMHGLLFG